MTFAPDQWLAVVLICFCRVGSCLMLVPGISSGRVPVRFRLSVCLALSLIVSTSVGESILAALARDGTALPWLVATETSIGLGFGLFVRMLFAGAQMSGVLVAASLGLTQPMSPGLDDAEAVPPPADLVSLTAVVLALQADVHLDVIAALAESYRVVPVTSLPAPDMWLHSAVGAARDTTAVAVRLSAPLIAIALLVNVALGLAGRMLPMLPVQFLGAPMLLLVGLVVLARVVQDLAGGFVAEVVRLLAKA